MISKKEMTSSQQTSVAMKEEKEKTLRKEKMSMVDTMVKEGEEGGVTTLLLGRTDEKDSDNGGNY